MFENGIYSYCKFVASEHRKNLSPSPGKKKLPSKKGRQSKVIKKVREDKGILRYITRWKQTKR